MAQRASADRGPGNGAESRAFVRATQRGEHMALVGGAWSAPLLALAPKSSGHAIVILESERGEQDELCRRHHERPARRFDIRR